MQDDRLIRCAGCCVPGTSWQGSWDALYFHKMAYSGLAYYSRWDLNTGPGFLAPELAQAGANQTADNVACNLARLAWRMAGDRLLAVTTAAPARPTPAAAFNTTRCAEACIRAVF